MSGYRTPEQRRAYRDSIHAYERTPVWKLRSRQFRDRHGPKCDGCGVITNRSNPMHAHHRTYPRALNGTERDKDLRGVCGSCHQAIHRLARGRVSLEDATDWVVRYGPSGRPGVWRRLFRYLTGL